jgi:Bacteriophage Lambda NinG protein
MKAISATKTHKCKVCKAAYTKRNPWQSLCGSAECAVSIAVKSKAKRDRLDRAETRQKLEALATRRDWVKKAQTAVNAFIRARDADKPCISCGTTAKVSYHAGHYLSTSARPNLRFNPLNIHKQCAQCNLFLSGNPILYRMELIKRIGLELVEGLEADNTTMKYTKDDLRAIATKYKLMTKELQK